MGAVLRAAMLMLPVRRAGSALQSGSTAPALHMQSFVSFVNFVVRFCGGTVVGTATLQQIGVHRRVSVANAAARIAACPPYLKAVTAMKARPCITHSAAAGRPCLRPRCRALHT